MSFAVYLNQATINHFSVHSLKFFTHFRSSRIPCDVCVCVILRPRACELHSIIWMLHFYGEEPPASEKRRKNVEHICVRHWINNNGIRKKNVRKWKKKTENKYHTRARRWNGVVLCRTRWVRRRRYADYIRLGSVGYCASRQCAEQRWRWKMIWIVDSHSRAFHVCSDGQTTRNTRLQHHHHHQRVEFHAFYAIFFLQRNESRHLSLFLPSSASFIETFQLEFITCSCAAPLLMASSYTFDTRATAQRAKSS